MKSVSNDVSDILFAAHDRRILNVNDDGIMLEKSICDMIYDLFRYVMADECLDLRIGALPFRGPDTTRTFARRLSQRVPLGTQVQQGAQQPVFQNALRHDRDELQRYDRVP